MHEKRTDQLSLPKPGTDHHDAKTGVKINSIKTRIKVRLNMKRLVINTTKPHKIRTAAGPPI